MSMQFETPSDAPGETRPTPRTGQNTGSLARRLVLATLAFCVLFTVATVLVRTWFACETNLATMNAELTLIDQVFQGTQAGGDAEGEVDAEQLAPELCHVFVDLLAGHDVDRFHDGEQEGHAEGQGDEQEVVQRGHRELQPGEVDD